MPRGKRETCDLCCNSIQKDQDSLKCEGDCGCIVHRYCAGVTKTHYDALVKNSTPSVCQFCSLKTTNAVIRQLQTEIESLKTEVAALKELSMSSTDAPSATSTSYAAVTATAANAQLGRRPPRHQRKAAAKPPTSTRPSAAKTTDPAEAAKDAGSQASRTREPRKVAVVPGKEPSGEHYHLSLHLQWNQQFTTCYLCQMTP